MLCYSIDTANYMDPSCVCDMLAQCTFNSDACFPTDFELIPTNMGFCFSFNPGTCDSFSH